jgi:hypothetical protein
MEQGISMLLIMYAVAAAAMAIDGTLVMYGPPANHS